MGRNILCINFITTIHILLTVLSQSKLCTSAMTQEWLTLTYESSSQWAGTAQISTLQQILYQFFPLSPKLRNPLFNIPCCAHHGRVGLPPAPRYLFVQIACLISQSDNVKLNYISSSQNYYSFPTPPHIYSEISNTIYSNTPIHSTNAPRKPIYTPTFFSYCFSSLPAICV